MQGGAENQLICLQLELVGWQYNVHTINPAQEYMLHLCRQGNYWTVKKIFYVKATSWMTVEKKASKIERAGESVPVKKRPVLT